MMADHLPPTDIEAEEAVLGCVMINPGCFTAVAAIVDANDFSREFHYNIFTVMTQLVDSGTPPDILTVMGALRDQDLEPEGISLRKALGLMAATVPTTVHADKYALRVKECSIKRQAMRSASQITEMAANGKSASSVVEQFHKSHDDLAKLIQQTEGGNMAELLDEFLQLDEYEKPGNEDALPTGITPLDFLLSGGFYKGNLIIAGGRPGVGKSMLAGELARNAIAAGRKVAWFSYEMTQREVMMRLLATYAKIDQSLIRAGKMGRDMTDQFHASLLKHWEALEDRLTIIAGASAQLQSFTQTARLQKEKGMDLLILDYLGLLEVGKEGETKSYERTTLISRRVKQLAQELDIPVIALSQMNRYSQRNATEPTLVDLRDSGALEQDADIVLLLHRDDKLYSPKQWQDKFPDKPYPRGMMQVKLAKNRHGPEGRMQIKWREHTGEIELSEVLEYSTGD